MHAHAAVEVQLLQAGQRSSHAQHHRQGDSAACPRAEAEEEMPDGGQAVGQVVQAAGEEQHGLQVSDVGEEGEVQAGSVHHLRAVHLKHVISSSLRGGDDAGKGRGTTQ